MSSLFKIVCFVVDLNISFELSLTLPTSDKSYLSLEKYKFLNTSSATSIVGASPGLITLYISFNASSLLLFLSIFSVSSR